MLKINPQILTDPAATAIPGPMPESADGAASPAALRHQVELLTDGNIKLLLEALGKTLGEFMRLRGELPPAAAREAQTMGQAALGADTVLPRGLAALVRGARGGGETLTAFAQTIADAAALSEAFPEGLQPDTAAAAANFAARAGEGGNFTARLLALARQLADAPNGAGTPLALAAALLAELPDAADLPPAVREEMARAAAALDRSLPEKVRQAAEFHNLPALRDALVWQKVADSLPWLKLSRETLQQTHKTLLEMAAAQPASQQSTVETAGQKVLVMTMPLFFADGRAYPAYIHISRDREQHDNPAAPVRETWLRLCVVTDNIGAVDMVFHLRGEQQLSIRVSFADKEAGEEFRGVLGDLRGALAESELSLADIAVVS